MRRLWIVALLLLGALPVSAAPKANVVDPQTGESVTIAPGPGVLHVVFFATWCPGCVKELPRLAELDARWSDAGYRQAVVAVRARHTVERLRRFAEEHPQGARILFDGAGAAEQAFDARQVPTHLLLDRDGRELARARNLTEAFEQAIAEALGEGRR